MLFVTVFFFFFIKNQILYTVNDYSGNFIDCITEFR